MDSEEVRRRGHQPGHQQLPRAPGEGGGEELRTPQVLWGDCGGKKRSLWGGPERAEGATPASTPATGVRDSWGGVPAWEGLEEPWGHGEEKECGVRAHHTDLGQRASMPPGGRKTASGDPGHSGPGVVSLFSDFGRYLVLFMARPCLALVSTTALGLPASL